MPRDSRATILRGIGRWDLVALMINVTIGAGILGLPARIFELTHAYSLLVLVACAALVGVIAICFAEVGSRFSDSGGPYLIARTALGPRTGFIVGWLYWISRVLTFATICNLLVAYVARFVPTLAGEALRVLIIAIVVTGVTAIHLLGIRHATIVGNALTLLKVAFLAVFGVAGLANIGEISFGAAPAPAMGDLSDALLLAIFAFVGFEAAFVSAGETRDPRRDTPFAVAAALAIILALYLGVQIVCMGAVPSLADSSAPVADAATAMWGPAGELVIACGAIIIMLGSLNAGFLATTRLPFAFAEQGDLPSVLSRVHPQFRTPHVAILGSGVLVLVATLASSFLSAITLATSTRMVVYVAGCAALIALRKRADAPPAGFVAPAGRTFAVIAIALSLLLLVNASGRELVQLAIAGASGMLIYALQRRRESK
ncbi:MAG: APC family permease [Steroidobacter sp.]